MTDGYTLAYLLPASDAAADGRCAPLVEVEPDADEREEHIDVFGNRVLQFGVHHQHDALRCRPTAEVVVEPMHLDGDGPAVGGRSPRTCGRARGGEALLVRPFAGGVPLVERPADVAELRRLGDVGVPPRPPVIDAAPRALPHHPRDVRVRPHVHRRVDAAGDGARRPPRRVPGLRPPRRRRAALARPRRAVRERVHRDRPAARAGRASSAPTRRTRGARCGCPSVGWVDFDPTNDHLPVHRHVTLAWGRDYGDVPPVRGVVIGPARPPEALGRRRRSSAPDPASNRRDRFPVGATP